MTNTKHPGSRTALIIGASGLIGSYCLQALLRDNVYSLVKTLVRREMNTQHDKLLQHVVDFENLTNYKDLIQADDIFCCLGTTIKKAGSQEQFKQVDFRYPLEVAKIAKENSAQQYLIVTALGADPDSNIFYNKVKGEVEKALSALQYDTLQVFQPSLLLGDRDEKRIGESIGQSLFSAFSFAFVGPLRKYKGIEGEVVAQVMVHQAKKGLQGEFVIESKEIQEIYANELTS